MGQNGDSQVGKTTPEQHDNGHKDGGVALSQYVMTEAQQKAMGVASDNDAAAPDTFGERAWLTTKEGVQKIPQGFMNSLNPDHILPNVAAGALIGAATRIILPESGPIAKVAGVALTTYFLGKPMYDTYKGAYFAETMGDIHNASDIFGNTIGGLPVGMAEGAIGGYIGSRAAGWALGTRALTPFTEWKANQYDKLDVRIDNGMANLRNFAYDRFGVGSPVVKADTVHGMVPPHLLEEMARRNPNGGAAETIRKMNAFKEEWGDQRTPKNGAVNAEGTAPRRVYDAQGQEIQPGKLIRSEGQKPSGNADVDASYDQTGNVRTFYKEVHGRNSIDGKGMPLDSTVNYGNNFENAFWDGKQMTYGRPGPESPFKTFIKQDVTGHEMTHGVTEFEARTVYRKQAGALNEHFSDVWGELVEQRAAGQTAQQADWLVGKGIWKDNVKGTALRSMLEPGKAYNDPLLGKDPQPGHMRDYVNTARDNGGVHINSGIPNRGFAEFARSVGGNAWERPADIWFRARSQAGSNPSFAQFAYQTIEAAKSLGHADLVPKLQTAWETVGVKPSATDLGLLTRHPTWIPLVAGSGDAGSNGK